MYETPLQLAQDAPAYYSRWPNVSSPRARTELADTYLFN